jgi:hypothetical protein
MPIHPPRCVRCNSAMEAGFVVDNGRDLAQRQATWASGDAQFSFWRQSDVAKDARRMRVTTFRCERCGYLESYANEAAD